VIVHKPKRGSRPLSRSSNSTTQTSGRSGYVGQERKSAHHSGIEKGLPSKSEGARITTFARDLPRQHIIASQSCHEPHAHRGRIAASGMASRVARQTSSRDPVVGFSPQCAAHIAALDLPSAETLPSRSTDLDCYPGVGSRIPPAEWRTPAPPSAWAPCNTHSHSPRDEDSVPSPWSLGSHSMEDFPCSCVITMEPLTRQHAPPSAVSTLLAATEPLRAMTATPRGRTSPPCRGCAQHSCQVPCSQTPGSWLVTPVCGSLVLENSQNRLVHGPDVSTTKRPPRQSTQHRYVPRHPSCSHSNPVYEYNWASYSIQPLDLPDQPLTSPHPVEVAPDVKQRPSTNPHMQRYGDMPCRIPRPPQQQPCLCSFSKSVRGNPSGLKPKC
jgi:hypothetical protein